MANSGIIIDDAVVKEFEKMRGGKPDTRPAYIFFNFVDGDSRIAVTEIGEPNVSFEDFQQKLLAMDRPVYAVVDFPWEDTNHQKNKTLFFVAWCLDSFPIKQKMLVASSKKALKEKLVGCQFEIQAADMDDILPSCFKARLNKRV